MPAVAESMAIDAEVPTSRDNENSITAPASSDRKDSSELHALLEIGDKAPEISVESWLRNEPTSVLGPDTVHVVEFWETTCLPCLDSMAHMASLQQQYGDQVTFIGISPENVTTVTEFLEQKATANSQKWSDVLNYAIGIDHLGLTRAAYMDASELDGIPCAFIVGRSGHIEWFGHSQDIDIPLKEIVEGTWDSATAKQLVAGIRSAKKAKLEMGPDIRAAIDSGEYPLAVELIDQLLQRFPNDTDLPVFRLQCLIQGNMLAEANASAGKLISVAQDDALQLNRLAWMMATATESPDIDLDLALSAATQAAALTGGKNASVIETMARLQFRKGQVAEAIKLQKSALDLNPNSVESGRLRMILEEYEKALMTGTEPEVNPHPPSGAAPGQATGAPATQSEDFDVKKQ